MDITSKAVKQFIRRTSMRYATRLYYGALTVSHPTCPDMCVITLKSDRSNRMLASRWHWYSDQINLNTISTAYRWEFSQ